MTPLFYLKDSKTPIQINNTKNTEKCEPAKNSIQTHFKQQNKNNLEFQTATFKQPTNSILNQQITMPMRTPVSFCGGYSVTSQEVTFLILNYFKLSNVFIFYILILIILIVSFE